jgi:hypothetical protein
MGVLERWLFVIEEIDASTKELQQGSLLSTFVVQQNLLKEENCGNFAKVEQYITILRGVPTSDHQVLNPSLSP